MCFTLWLRKQVSQHVEEVGVLECVINEWLVQEWEWEWAATL